MPLVLLPHSCLLRPGTFSPRMAGISLNSFPAMMSSSTMSTLQFCEAIYRLLESIPLSTSDLTIITNPAAPGERIRRAQFPDFLNSK